MTGDSICADRVKKYGKAGRIYSFATENIAHVKREHVDGARVFAVCGSGDQALWSLGQGAVSVDCADVCETALLWGRLKAGGVCSLGMDGFKGFFMRGKEALSPFVLETMEGWVDKATMDFWMARLSDFNMDGFALRESDAFNLRFDSNKEKERLVPWLSSAVLFEDVAQATRRAVSEGRLGWLCLDVTNPGSSGIPSDRLWDAAYFSNIAESPERFFAPPDQDAALRDAMVSNWLPKMGPTGVVMVGYAYAKPREKNGFGLPEKRRGLYGGVDGWRYFEDSVPTALTATAGFDSACFLKRVRSDG